LEPQLKGSAAVAAVATVKAAAAVASAAESGDVTPGEWRRRRGEVRAWVFQCFESGSNMAPRITMGKVAAVSSEKAADSVTEASLGRKPGYSPARTHSTLSGSTAPPSSNYMSSEDDVASSLSPACGGSGSSDVSGGSLRERRGMRALSVDTVRPTETRPSLRQRPARGTSTKERRPPLGRM